MKKSNRPRISKDLVWFMGLGSLLWLFGCSSDTTTTQPPQEFAPPTSLTYVNADTDVLLSWDASPDAAADGFAGYAVYRDSVSMLGLADADLARYRRNAAAIRETIYQDAVQPGRKWYYAVRAVKSNGDVSTATNEINTAARPLYEGNVVGEFSWHGMPSGLECSTGEPWAMRSDNPDNRPHIDVYLGTDDPEDALGHPLVLKSPDLVLDSSPLWSTRSARLKLLGSSADAWDAGTTADDGWETEVALGATSNDAVGKVIVLRTPADGTGQYHYAKLRITAAGVSGTNGERSLEVEVAFQPIPNYIRFRRPL